MFASTLVVGRHLCCCHFLFTAPLKVERCLLLLSLGFHPPREALLLFPGFRPLGEALLWSSGFLPPREAGAADVDALASELCLGVSSLKGSGAASMTPRSLLVLGVSSPKGSWGVRCCRSRQRIMPRGFVPPREAGAVDVAALASELCLGVFGHQGKLGRCQ